MQAQAQAQEGHGSRHGSRRGPCQEPTKRKPLPHLSISWPRVVGLLVVPLLLLVRAGPRAAAHCSFPGDPFPSLSHFASLLGPVDLLIFLSCPALRLLLPLLLSFPLICCLNVGAAGSRNPSTFSLVSFITRSVARRQRHSLPGTTRVYSTYVQVVTRCMKGPEAFVH